MSDKKQPMDVFDTAMTIAVADVLAQTDYPGELTESEMGTHSCRPRTDCTRGRPEQARAARSHPQQRSGREGETAHTWCGS